MTTFLTLTNLLPHDFSTNFWTYDGSLTTPLCYESVKWIVSQSVQEVSADQLEVFRHLYQDESGSRHITHNYRPVQNIHERIVKIKA